MPVGSLMSNKCVMPVVSRRGRRGATIAKKNALNRYFTWVHFKLSHRFASCGQWGHRPRQVTLVGGDINRRQLNALNCYFTLHPDFIRHGGQVWFL
jgi:hypothetical protein